MENTNDYWVQCNVCHQRYQNWVGSTPCCGSLAGLVEEDGTVSSKVILIGSVNGGDIEPLTLDFGNKKI